MLVLQSALSRNVLLADTSLSLQFHNSCVRDYNVKCSNYITVTKVFDSLTFWGVALFTVLPGADIGFVSVSSVDKLAQDVLSQADNVRIKPDFKPDLVAQS